MNCHLSIKRLFERIEMILRGMAIRLKLIVNHRTPYTMISCYFLLPKQSDAMKLHRHVMLKSWQKQPIVFWIPIYFCTWILWLSCFGWLMLIRIYLKQAKKLKQIENISLTKQLQNLFSLTFLFGVPPHFYYQFNLFRFPEKEWFNYIFTHELPAWHLAFNLNNNQKSQQIISDKYRFAQQMADAGIPTVPTMLHIPSGSTPKPEDLFRKESIFLKPSIGSQSKGCFELHYDSSTDSYTIPQSQNETNPKDLYNDILNRIKASDTLLQPLLINHETVEELCLTEELTTLRIITAYDRSTIHCISAVAEMPLENEKFWYVMKIDEVTGRLMKGNSYRMSDKIEKYDEQFAHLPGTVWPFWNECLDICFKAHEQVSDLLTVGWDVAVTPDGPILIEGNTNWGVITAQCLNNTPLLCTKLKDIYTKKIKMH